MRIEISEIKISKLFKKFIKNSLVIINLFVVSYYCVVALVLLFVPSLEYNIFTLILVLVIPLIVFLGFFCLVKSYYESLGIKYPENLLKMQKIEVMNETYFMVTKEIKSDSGKDNKQLQKVFKEMFKLLSEINLGEERINWEYTILYDDDNMRIIFTKLK